MLLRRHGKHKQRSRMGLAGNPMVPLDGQSDEEKKDLPENDNRGVYELPARRSPVQLHAGELER